MVQERNRQLSREQDGTSVPTKSRGQEFGMSDAIQGRNVPSNQADPPKKSSWMLLQRWDKEMLQVFLEGPYCRKLPSS